MIERALRTVLGGCPARTGMNLQRRPPALASAPRPAHAGTRDRVRRSVEREPPRARGGMNVDLDTHAGELLAPPRARGDRPDPA